MVTKFDELCRTIGIDSSTTSAEDLAKLINWCETTVSTDLHFEGTLEERFDAYQDLASGFLEHIQPNIQADRLTSPVPEFNNMTPLQFLVDVGLDIYLKTLKPKPEQVNTKINDISLLQLAAIRGKVHTVETLLALGANPEEKITRGSPILCSTLMLPIDYDEKLKQNKQSIYTLLSRASKKLLDERNQSGDTILHTMSIYGYSKLIEDMLTNKREFASIPNNLMHYPVHSAILNGHEDCVELLIAVAGVEKLNDAKGRNALHYAAKYGDDGMVKICLNSSISKDSVDKRKQTPLILAAIAQNSAAVKEFIDFGAQNNWTDDVNRSALHYAVESNDVDIVRLLLASRDINVNISDDHSQNPLDLAQSNTPEGIMISELLIAKGAIHGRSLTNSI